MNYRAVLCLALFFSGCTSTHTSISFTKSRVPLDDYREVGSIGVAKARGLPPRDNDYLFQKIKKCPLFRKSGVINEFIEPKYSEPAKLAASMDAEVTNYREAAAYTGILALSVLKNERKTASEIEQIVQVKDSGEHQWIADHPLAMGTDFGLSGNRLIGPKLSSKAEQINQKSHTFNIEIAYVLYNAVLKKVVKTDTLVTEVSLHHFSTKPALSADRIRDLVVRGMLDQIAWMACGVDGEVSRDLYIEAAGKSATQQREGLDSVKGERWEKAEKSFKNAQQADTKNALTYHDLGVLEERAGQPLQAANYYRKAQGKRLADTIQTDEYSRLTSGQFKGFDSDLFQNSIYSVVGGYWALFNRGTTAGIKPGATYPVYRLRHVYDKSYNVIGPALTEVGEVSIVAIKGSFVVGKINRFVLPDGVASGDFVWMH